MMGKIWESAMRATKKPLNFSGLPRVHATLAGERLRPLGHVSVAPFREGELRKQDQNGPKCSYLEKSMVLDPKTNLHVVGRCLTQRVLHDWSAKTLKFCSCSLSAYDPREQAL